MASLEDFPYYLYPEEVMYKKMKNLIKVKYHKWSNWWPADTWYDSDGEWADWSQWAGDWSDSWWDWKYDRHESPKRCYIKEKDGLLRTLINVKMFQSKIYKNLEKIVKSYDPGRVVGNR